MRAVLFEVACLLLILVGGCVSHPDPSQARQYLSQKAIDNAGSEWLPPDGDYNAYLVSPQ